ncbi:hypothetical protein ACFVYA_21015 [Amycolatopsis sp. NPDC058278]|uniref:hypothetical protein n=1 Tax=Amycolatopsis sp. NPDC058278 TaxID=3346417 RepID=UPI0036DB426F
MLHGDRHLRTRLKPGRELDYEAAHRLLPDDIRDDLVHRCVIAGGAAPSSARTGSLSTI